MSKFGFSNKEIKRVKTKLIFSAIAGILFFCWIISAVHAASLSCSGGDVYIGDPRMDLISKCGNADDTEYGHDTIGVPGGNGIYISQTRSVQKLFYNCGAGRLNRTVTIFDGRVAKITTGNYGTGPNRCE